MTFSMMAASVTDSTIGPAVSCVALIGTLYVRGIRPTVGLMPTSMLALEGLRIDPEVSVPTLAAHRLAAVPIPELEPPVAIAKRALQKARLEAFDVVLLDTAGRLSIDDELMDEAAAIRDAARASLEPFATTPPAPGGGA